MRPGAGFGVVLHRESRHVPAHKALYDAVVQVDVARFYGGLERAGDNGVIVVLARYLDRAGGQPPDGVVTAVVPERQFVRRSPERQGQKLVAQADAEHRYLAEQGPYRLGGAS